MRTPNQADAWTFADMADHFDTLDQHTFGMSHPERVAFLANELSLHGDDEELTSSKARAWLIIEAWEHAKGTVARVAADTNVDPVFRAVLADRARVKVGA